MIPSRPPIERSLVLLIASGAMLLAPEVSLAQYTTITQAPGYTDGYTYTEINPTSNTPLLFGVAAYRICQIKTFLFSGVYILGAIAFVIFAIRALFTKFEMKHFLPIIGALFIVATADLFIYWISAEEAYYCPTALGGL